MGDRRRTRTLFPLSRLLTSVSSGLIYLFEVPGLAFPLDDALEDDVPLEPELLVLEKRPVNALRLDELRRYSPLPML